MPQDTPTDRPARAWHSPLCWALFVVPALVGMGLDLYLKHDAFPDGVGRQPNMMTTLVPGVLGFQTTINRGAVFGMAQGQVPVLIAISFVALIVISYLFVSSARHHRWLHVGLGLVLAGALGNLYDRICYGHVRDMLRFMVDWYPYIFNVADVLLCVGGPLVLLSWIGSGKEPSVTKAVSAKEPIVPPGV